MCGNEFIAKYKSSPARGTWVEIVAFNPAIARIFSRLPHGGRGLKFNPQYAAGGAAAGRLPHGGRGLKFGLALSHLLLDGVVSRTGDVG